MKKQIKKLFTAKRPGKRQRKYDIPYHEDREQRKRWEREKHQRDLFFWMV